MAPCHGPFDSGWVCSMGLDFAMYWGPDSGLILVAHRKIFGKLVHNVYIRIPDSSS